MEGGHSQILPFFCIAVFIFGAENKDLVTFLDKQGAIMTLSTNIWSCGKFFRAR